jgi:hypothetical protein
MVAAAMVVGVLIAGLVALVWRPRVIKEEEFVLTLQPGAPQAKAGDRVRLRATADDGVALEGDFVVAKASGAWVTVRRLLR